MNSLTKNNLSGIISVLLSFGIIIFLSLLAPHFIIAAPILLLSSLVISIILYTRKIISKLTLIAGITLFIAFTIFSIWFYNNNKSNHRSHCYEAYGCTDCNSEGKCKCFYDDDNGKQKEVYCTLELGE